MKSLVYASIVDSDKALVARIAVVAGDIREMPGVFANVRKSLWWRLKALKWGLPLEILYTGKNYRLPKSSASGTLRHAMSV
ncbi:hypothetical protein TNCV_1278491 [Trichonephila clavipes]|nr:hypothetical protein TNCV_1278491 [Trichonephila clavipes]